MRYLVLSALLCAFAACGDGAPLAPPSDLPLRLSVVSGDGQLGESGRTLPEPLVVRLTDESGQPYRFAPGVVLNWMITSGGGSTFVVATQTDWRGEARNWWTLGDAGPQSLEVRAVHPTTGERLVYGTFTATAAVPVRREINTTSGWDGQRQIGMFGAPPAATVFGQSFTVPADASVLTSLTFWLNAHCCGWRPEVIFSVYVMAWDGSKASGPVLWKAGPLVGPASPMQRYDVEVGALPLVAGNRYVAFLSTIEHLNVISSQAQVLMGYASNAYAGGRFYSSRAVDWGALTSSPWETDAGGDFDAAFIANFVGSIP